jgi:hypothetical protein
MSSRDPGQGSEDTRRNEEHVRAAEENRDALAAQARRTDATTDSDTTSRPLQGMDGGSSGTGTSSGGNVHGASGAAPGADAARAAAENRDALADESRRVEQTLPPGVEMRDE